MIPKLYPVAFEIAGPAAMFTRPDTGSAPVSYPVPTKSSLKSIFECVVRSEYAYFQPQRVEICRPIVLRKYSNNYGGPLRKSGTPNFQLFATILENVCYKVSGVIAAYQLPTSEINSQHQLQEVFLRRLKNGYLHTTPFLGWKEFVPDYFGPIRDSTVVDKNINLTVPSMLVEMYDRPTNGCLQPQFVQNVTVTKGVLNYD